jgi:hypothetical protein
MSGSQDGVFDFATTTGFAKGYLRQYYSRPPTNDEQLVLSFMARHLPRYSGVDCAIEVGCGPTLHHALALARATRELHLADYLDENLHEVSLWRSSSPEAHVWDAYTKLVLELEGLPSGERAVKERNELTRGLITQLLHCDIKNEEVITPFRTYPLVASFYCVEEVGISDEHWNRVLGHLVRLVAPGGWLMLVSLRDTDFYLVDGPNGEPLRYPCARVSEEGTRAALERLGFDPAEMIVENSDVDAQSHEGVTGVIMVLARRR